MKEFIMAGTLITNGLLVSGSSAYFESFDRIYKTSVPDPVNPVRLEVYDNGPLDLSDELVNQAANITAMSGSITLTTGAGNDTLAAGQGADSLDGGAGYDDVDFAGAAGNLFVDLAAGRETGVTGSTLESCSSTTRTAVVA